jgi:hypothetical protein
VADRGGCSGKVVAEHLAELSAAGKLPPLDDFGVLLAGDFFAEPQVDRRGGLGDVSEVWSAFGERCRWVAGVLGNHDLLAPPAQTAPLLPSDLTHVLDGTIVHLDGLRIGGVGGIIGKPTKVNRKTEPDYLRLLEDVLVQSPAIVLTHQQPDSPLAPGNHAIRAAFEPWSKTCADSAIAPPLLICGHHHWPTPLAKLSHGLQVLNVDARVFVLLRQSSFPG